LPAASLFFYFLFAAAGKDSSESSAHRIDIDSARLFCLSNAAARNFDFTECLQLLFILFAAVEQIRRNPQLSALTLIENGRRYNYHPQENERT